MAFMKIGAGDGDRTRDIQLGKLKPTIRLTHNQAVAKGATRLNAALSAPIEHNSEHKPCPRGSQQRITGDRRRDKRMTLGRRTIWSFFRKAKSKSKTLGRFAEG